ncbi:hypothetical protein D3C71_1023150 [compost metagenome]
MRQGHHHHGRIGGLRGHVAPGFEHVLGPSGEFGQRHAPARAVAPGVQLGLLAVLQAQGSQHTHAGRVGQESLPLARLRQHGAQGGQPLRQRARSAQGVAPGLHRGHGAGQVGLGTQVAGSSSAPVLHHALAQPLLQPIHLARHQRRGVFDPVQHLVG